MGAYDFAAQNVYKTATQLLHAKKLPAPPPWYKTIERVPPSTRLVRPPMQRNQEPGAKPPRQRKKSRLFRPLNLSYQEDALRWEYFNDHPWELARPRVMVENDGRDHEQWDWSLPLDYSLQRPRAASLDEYGRKMDDIHDERMRIQAARPINGEAVVQRQDYLIQVEGFTTAKAYDRARKELYRQRHAKEVETRVAREEALAVGAYFGPGPLEIGMHLEDKAYQDWKAWAVKEIAAVKQLAGSAYTGLEGEETEADEEDLEQEGLSAVSASVPAGRADQSPL